MKTFNLFKAIEMYFKKQNKKINEEDLNIILLDISFINKINNKILHCKDRRKLLKLKNKELKEVLQGTKRLFKNSNQFISSSSVISNNSNKDI